MKLPVWLAALSLLSGAHQAQAQDSAAGRETFQSCGFAVVASFEESGPPIIMGSCTPLETSPYRISAGEIVLSVGYHSTSWDRDPVGFEGSLRPLKEGETVPALKDLKMISSCLVRRGPQCNLIDVSVLSMEHSLHLSGRPSATVRLRGTTDIKGRDASHIGLDGVLFQGRDWSILVVILPGMQTSGNPVKPYFVYFSYPTGAD